MWVYRERYPAMRSSSIVTLGEGRTPVTHLSNGILLKQEQLNPSGSYKDRFASCGLSWMRERNLTTCLATSSGNTGAALAAYCARAGVRCRIFILENTPLAKTRQMLAYGAELVRVRGFGTDAQCTRRVMEELRAHAAETRAALLISAYAYSPEAMDGVKSIAYELAEQTAEMTDLFVPVGGGGLLTAVQRGLGDLHRAGTLPRLPRIHAVQPQGCATVCGPWQQGGDRAVPVECTTEISGLQVASVIDGDAALQAVRTTGGTGFLVSDADVYAAQKELVRQGIFCEPAGAAAYAGALQALNSGLIGSQARAVCLVTGHGCKDGHSIEKITADAVVPLRDAKNFLSRPE